MLYKARLDYIEVFYTRRLAIDGGELHFYGDYKAGEIPVVSGCSEQTVIWDVTNPASPEKVNYSLSEGNASFRITRSGYREFVAFNPSAVTRAATSATTVSNQNIHGLATPDMVIITLPEYRSGAEQIAELHETNDKLRVAVLDVQPIYNEFSGGKPDVGAFRKLLKMWYDRGESEDGHKLRYCLLMGKPGYDNKLVSTAFKNAGYTPMLIYQSYEGMTEETSYSCDDYIGMLEDVADANFYLASAKINVAVGRLPVTSAAEARQMASKLKKYVEQSELGLWRNKVMLIADDDDNGVHLKQAEAAYTAAKANGNGSSFVFDRLYLDSYKRVLTGIGATYPQVTERMLRNYNEGVMLTGYIGHANETSWGHEHLWEWPSITSMTNKNLTFIYAATCSFAYWDKPALSGAEELLLNPEAGIIGMIAASRKVYVDPNGPFSKSMFSKFFLYNEKGEALTYGDAYLMTRNEQRVSNSLRYLLMGDPALKIANPGLRVNYQTIDGMPADGSAALPELKAQSAVTVEGEILNPDGSLAEDFNGTLNLQLYDAERVITTYGQGASGAVLSYNDRDKRLSMTTAAVKDGKWTATLRVPPEIQGLYTKAMIAGYAFDDKRREANGITTSLYVYGYNENEGDDTEGPQIETLYVNSPNFQNGGLVNSNPVLFARVKDDSGINISDSGIGHAMTVTLDEKNVYSDLNSYFNLDPESANSGTLAYPLKGLAPGRHTLTLSVWDNANNVTKESIDINVGAAVDPVIYDIIASVTDVAVDFRIELDRPNTQLACEIGIFDLGGRRIWSYDNTLNTDMQSHATTTWNLTDSAGNRVQRGIYIYRVRVETPEGTYSTKSKKIAIAAK